MMDKYYFYQSYYYSLKGLKRETRYAIREAIDDFMFEDKEPNFKDALSNSIWMLLIPTLRKSKTKYENAKGKREADQEQNESEMKANEKRNESENGNPLPVRPSISISKEDGERKMEYKDNIPPVIPPKGGKFVPPTLDEVKAYIKEKGYDFDAEGFLAFYEANGWVQGSSKKPIKSWKACCVTWSKSPYNVKNQKTLHDKAFGIGETVEVRF